MLRARFELTPVDIYEMQEELDYTTLFELLGLPLPTLRDPEWTPLWPSSLPKDRAHLYRHADRRPAGPSPLRKLRRQRRALHQRAADDPQTVSIKMTAYRIGDDTPFVKSLIRAAERGKQVACVMEIKARFDEERNLHWAAELERVGAHVTFGVSGLKTHGKTALVVRKEARGLRCYVHIGTGNYHVKTARLYADVGLFTCDQRITEDVVESLPLPHRARRSAQLQRHAGGSDHHAAAPARSHPS